jgi:hypothetical protein
MALLHSFQKLSPDSTSYELQAEWLKGWSSVKISL